MIGIEITGIILAFIIFNIWGNSYDSYSGSRNDKIFEEKDKFPRPRWAVILLFFVSIIPILNVVLFIIILLIYGRLRLSNEIYFHSNSKFHKWLNKEV